jgi:hypothetical protein
VGKRGQSYPCVCDVLVALCGAVHAVPGRLVDVPELHPPVEQERVVCDLVLRQLGGRHRVGARLVHLVDAVRPHLGAQLLVRPELHLDVLAVNHGLGRRVVLIAQEVVIDVCVELLARVRGLRLLVGVRHVAHHGVAVDGPSVGVHGRHLRYLRVVHRDAVGRGGRRQAHSMAMDEARGGGWQGTRWLGHLGAAVDVVIMTWTAVATGVVVGAERRARRPGVWRAAITGAGRRAMGRRRRHKGDDGGLRWRAAMGSGGDAVMCRRPPLRLDPGDEACWAGAHLRDAGRMRVSTRSTTTTTAGMRAHNGARRNWG